MPEHISEKDPIQIADGIYWVGYPDRNAGLHCNPYLIVDGAEAVLVDGGSRDDFSNVMLKILRVGIRPSQISTLIYHHYDPDLCGSLPQLEAIIGGESLKVLSHWENNIFIHYYSSKTEKLDYRNQANCFEFTSGRKLLFYPTPYCHQPGSFVTYDTKTKTLLSSDLFGSFDVRWSLYLQLHGECNDCPTHDRCPLDTRPCPIQGILRFHERIMTSNTAATYTLDRLSTLDIERIAPQHGSVIESKTDVQTVWQHVRAAEHVGIDHLLARERP